jgi:SMC interacting uncharacterized protein involved in chromosome segregation
MRNEQVNYTAFIKAINELKEEGHTPSVRLVRFKIGGSNSKLVEYLRRWKSEAVFSANIDEPISDYLKEALMAEFGRITQAQREKYESMIQQEKEQIHEIAGLLLEAENKIVELESQIEVFNKQTNQAVLELEKQLAATQERAAELQRQSERAQVKYDKQIEMLQDKIAQLQLEAHQAHIKAAVAETKVIEITRKERAGEG